MPSATVLVIEDDEAVRRTVSQILRSAGYQVEEAVDGRDGVDAIVHRRFDLVITDLLMPRQAGVAAIKMIRDLDAEVPIIAISGAADPGPGSPLDVAMRMGANIRLAKPFDVDD